MTNPRTHLERCVPSHLISYGTIGLIKAVDRFDPKRNLKLKTLAEHRIRSAMLDYLRQIDPLPRSARLFQKKRDAVMDALSANGEIPGQEEIAKALGAPIHKYMKFSQMIAAAEPISLKK